MADEDSLDGIVNSESNTPRILDAINRYSAEEIEVQINEILGDKEILEDKFGDFGQTLRMKENWYEPDYEFWRKIGRKTGILKEPVPDLPVPKLMPVEEYLEMHPWVKSYYENDENWKEDRLQSSADIPTEYMEELEPLSMIVGKREIMIEILKISYQQVIKQLQRYPVKNTLMQYWFEREYIKRRPRLWKIFSERETELKQEIRNFDARWRQIFEEMAECGQYNREKAHNDINSKRKWYYLNVDSEHHSSISKRMMELFGGPDCAYLIGDWGSGKTIILQQIQKKHNRLCDEFGINGYELLGRRVEKDIPEVVKALQGEATGIVEDYKAKKRSREKAVKWGLGLGAAALLTYWTYGIVDAISSDNLRSILGYYVPPERDPDLAKDISLVINAQLDRIIAGIGQIGILGALTYGISQYLGDRNSSEPVKLTASATDKGAGVTLDDMIGKYDAEMSEVPPQKRFTASSFAAMDGRAGKIEQLSAVSLEAQEHLAEALAEGYLRMAGREGTEADFNCLLLIADNPNAKNYDPLEDRLKQQYTAYTVNEIEKTELDSRIFMNWLNWYRIRKCEGPPIDRKAMFELLKISNILSENKYEITINRSFIGILRAAIAAANGEKDADLVTIDHVKAAVNAKGRKESNLNNSILEFYRSTQLKNGPGVVNVVAYAVDKTLHDESDDQRVMKRIAGLDGQGYVYQVKADVVAGSGLQIEMPDFWSNEEKTDCYRAMERRLAQHKNTLNELGLDYGNSLISVDVSRALSYDDSLISGMYMAVVSAATGKQLDPESAIMMRMDLDGAATGVQRMCKRIFNIESRPEEIISLSKIYVPQSSLDKQFVPEYYNVEFKGVNNIHDLCGELK